MWRPLTNKPISHEDDVKRFYINFHKLLLRVGAVCQSYIIPSTLFAEPHNDGINTRNPQLAYYRYFPMVLGGV